MRYEIKKTTLTDGGSNTATLITLAKQTFKKIGMDGLPLNALGLSGNAKVSVSHVIMDGHYIDWCFEVTTISDLELDISARVIGISDDGFILIQESSINFMVATHES